MRNFSFYLLINLLLVTQVSAADTQLIGRDIAIKARNADNSQDAQRKATMVIQRGNKQLTRKMRILEKKYGDDKRTLIRFEQPADVRGTQYLSWVYEDVVKNDDLWVYLPTENLIRRISGGGKKGAFMRSDFANEDIEQRAVDDDTHQLIGTETYNDRESYVVESTPIVAKVGDSNYAKRRQWIDHEYWLPLKIEYYDKRGRLLKTLIQGEIKLINGIWTATKLVMQTPSKKSRTLLQYLEVSYNNDLQDNLFQQSSLKR